MAFSSCLPQASESVKIHPQRDRKHNDFHHKLRPNHTIKAKNQVHHDEQGDVQQSLAAERQHGGLYALFSNRYFSASCSMDIIAFSKIDRLFPPGGRVCLYINGRESPHRIVSFLQIFPTATRHNLGSSRRRLQSRGAFRFTAPVIF